MERPRQKGHGDYATNVALQLAKKAGTNPRELRRAARRRGSRRPTASPRSRSPGPGFLNITVDAGAQGQVAAEVVAAGAAYGALRRVRRREDQPRVRLRQPDRPAPHRRRPLGGGRRRARPGLRDDRRRGHPRVLLQRPRRPDRPVRPARCWPRRTGEPAPEDGYGGEYIARDRRRPSWREQPDVLDLPDDEAQEVVPRGRRRPDVRGDQADPARLRRRLRRLLPRGRRCTRAAPSTRADRPAARARATSTRRTARSGCAPSSSATTRTGSSSSPTASGAYLVRRPRLLPRQAGARLRPLLHHARRRPPRLRRPDDGDVRRRSATSPTSTSRS